MMLWLPILFFKFLFKILSFLSSFVGGHHGIGG